MKEPLDAQRMTGPNALDATAWMDSALCAAQPETFFAGGRRGGSLTPALKICRRCPVRAQCADWALGQDIPHGVLGGMTAKTRRRLQRQRGETA